MKKHIAQRTLIAFLAASLLLAACGDQGSSSQNEPSSSETAVSSSAPETSSTPKDEDGPYSLPLVTDGSVTISISSPDCKVCLLYTSTGRLQLPGLRPSAFSSFLKPPAKVFLIITYLCLKVNI